LPAGRPGGGRPDVGGRPGVGGGPGGGGGPGIGSGRPGVGGGRPDIGGSRPGVGGGPGIGGGRPDIGGGRPGVGGGGRPGGAGRPSTLPSTRPDIGGRPGIAGRPGISTLPAIGLGAAAGAGIRDRVGDRPAATLPGLGDRPGVGNRTPEQRRDALRERMVGEGRPDQLPARDWNQTRQDWQDRRDQVRDDWQDHRDEAREDWQGWFDDHYGWYNGWYLGHAPGYWDRWDYMWDQHPVAAAVGLTWWAANSLGYQFGYSDYVNPYYAETMPAYYSEPVLTVPVAVEAAAQPGSDLPPGVSPEAVAKFDQARAAFLEGRYEEALKLTDAAVALMPHDAVLHEFRSLVLFALQRYAESAAAIHAVLDVGPGWDWKTLSGLYPSIDAYTTQLRALEAAITKDPQAADLRFLAGYHYLTCGHPDAALKQFRQAAGLAPGDTVSAALVAQLSPRDTQAPKTVVITPPDAVPADKIVGDWTAAGKGTAKYALGLGKDGTFTWEFTKGKRKQAVKGVYTVEGNVLAMEPESGGVLLAEMTAKGPDTLHFKMVGGAAGDPGLEFRRGQP
jgi:tetratricopeptide (TPR) repeat protein